MSKCALVDVNDCEAVEIPAALTIPPSTFRNHLLYYLPFQTRIRNNLGATEDSMIRNATAEDFEEIFNVINDGAIAYKGVIPPDRWHEPYMTKEELRTQIEDGVRFSCYVDDDEIIGVMGIQDKADVALIRHAYVRTKQRKKGIGSILLQELIKD